MNEQSGVCEIWSANHLLTPIRWYRKLVQTNWETPKMVTLVEMDQTRTLLAGLCPECKTLSNDNTNNFGSWKATEEFLQKEMYLIEGTTNPVAFVSLQDMLDQVQQSQIPSTSENSLFNLRCFLRQDVCGAEQQANPFLPVQHGSSSTDGVVGVDTMFYDSTSHGEGTSSSLREISMPTPWNSGNETGIPHSHLPLTPLQHHNSPFLHVLPKERTL